MHIHVEDQEGGLNMPWRKYTKKKGKYGDTYIIAPGINVRKDIKRNWVIFINIKNTRKNKSIGPGTEGLKKAILSAELIADKLEIKTHQISIGQSAKLYEKDESIIFSEYAIEFFDRNEKRWDHKTYERYTQLYKDHISVLNFANQPINKIRRKMIKEGLQQIYKNYSPSTVEIAHSVIHSIFEDAIDDEIRDEGNPAAKLLKKILPPIKNRNVTDSDPFSKEELSHFMVTAERITIPQEVLILKIMAYMGFRVGEALAVHIENFQFFNEKNPMYHIVSSFKNNIFKVKGSKGNKKRFVDIPGFLIQPIKAHLTFLKKESLAEGRGGDFGYLFLDHRSDYNYPTSQRVIQRLVARVCRTAGLRKRTPHDLRHTYATLLLMEHISPAYVQKQLGHSTISTTIDIYGHWVPGEGRKNLEKAFESNNDAKYAPEMHISAYRYADDS